MEDKKSEISMYLLFSSLWCDNGAHAGLCQIKIPIIDEGGDEVICSPEEESSVIKPFVTYVEDLGHELTYFSSVPALGSIYFLLSSEIYDVPRGMLWTYEDNPCHRSIFGKITPAGEEGGSCITDYPLPSTSKMFPFAAAVGNKVYFLSTPSNYLPEPSFEAYDLDTQKWETLATPPFYKNWVRFDYSRRPTGFAVYKHLIIVCLMYPYSAAGYPLFTYNTISGRWKPVKKSGIKYPGEDCSLWQDEAIVVGSKIYGHECDLPGLVSYPCTVVARTGLKYFDLCMGPPSLMRGYNPPPLPFFRFEDKSVRVAKIKGRLICVIQTTYNCDVLSPPKQPVFVSIIRIDNRPGLCTTLKTIQLDLVEFPSAVISACLVNVMQPEVNSSTELGDREYKGSGAASVSVVETMANNRA